jgi:urease accessory protein
MMVQQKLGQLSPVAIFRMGAIKGGCIATIASLSWLATLQPAAAHHLMGGRMPSNAWEGFLSGLGHPIIGLDHLAFVVAVGLLSTQYLRGWRLPIFFLASAMVGTAIHLLKINLPATESAIALSVITLGIILTLRKRFNFVVLASLFTIAGLFHGYAYGESIFGAESSPLVAYLVGFTVIQSAIALFAYRLGSSAHKVPNLHRAYGLIACLIGAVFLATSLHFQ